MKFFEIIFLGPHSYFSDIKLSNYNRMDNFDFFIAIFVLNEDAATSG